MAKTEKPLTKGSLTRTPGTATERVQMLSQGWSESKPKPTKPEPKSN